MVRSVPMQPVLFRNTRLFAPAAEDGATPPTDVLVENGRIAAIGPQPRRDGQHVIEGNGNLLLPGLVNGHFHSSVTHMKGSLDSLPLELFMLYESPASEVLRPTPREAYLRTMLGALEMLRCGTTAVQDDAFFVPHPTPDVIDAVCQAYVDCGIRATVALDQPDLAELDKLPYLRDLLPPPLRDVAARLPEFDRHALLQCYRHLIERWHGAADQRLRAAVSCSAPQRVSAAYLDDLMTLSATHNLPFYAHMLETRLQRVFGQRCLGGRSLVQLAADRGLLSPRLNVIHAIWVDDADLDLIADAGAVIAHNPISNLRLGSGVMPFRRMRDRGIPICLGSDEAIADDAINMWAVAKAAGLVHNIADADHAAWPRAGEILDCLLAGGARAMGPQDRLGAVAVGQLADLVLLDLDTLAFTPLNDLRRQLVYCENGSSVVLTMVAGRIVYADGQVTTVDERAIRAEARSLFTERRGALAAARAEAGAVLPYYQAMYRLALDVDVGMHRWVGG